MNESLDDADKLESELNADNSNETTAVEEITDEEYIEDELEEFEVAADEDAADDEDEDPREDDELVDSNATEECDTETDEIQSVTKRKRRRRRRRKDAAEIRLLGRRALCPKISDLAPLMLKTVKLRVLSRLLESKRGLEDDDLTDRIRTEIATFSSNQRITQVVNTLDPDVNRRVLKWIMVFAILLQEEIHACEENRLDEKILEYEKNILKAAEARVLLDPKQHDVTRWHHYDTYRIVLQAAWRNEDDVSQDEANLLAVLRRHLNISMEEHCVLSACIDRFPKPGKGLHTRDEINEARKELQREGMLFSYRDENNRNMDVIPAEIVNVVREIAELELQRTNFRRMLQHDNIRRHDLQHILQSHSMDRYGKKADLIERIVASEIRPGQVLDSLDRAKQSDMCAALSLKFSGNKADLLGRLIEFYDDLTFEERVTKDPREEWYNDYELLASRAYADLRAKKLISKDLEIEHKFEAATDFLFEVKLNVKSDRSKKESRADGRLPFDNGQVMLWDCKSAEGEVNVQDYLDSQFDGYLRKEREAGKQPLAFLVVAPCFTESSLKAAHQYKARTNWDIALVTAEGLRHLADQWNAMEPQKPFPIKLLNQTDLIDKQRAAYLLSLA